ncbi:hypothetical protein EDB89DRAFT_2069559 [Lactarius sanguifluus]|nr:hypothetical protein EDB89DRAFT_2069559 [Lactarius sanguifluus]
MSLTYLISQRSAPAFRVPFSIPFLSVPSLPPLPLSKQTCRGLKVLVDLLDEDSNDFYRLFVREDLLDLLWICTFFVFCQVSQSDLHVRNALSTRKVVRRAYCTIDPLRLTEIDHLQVVASAIKHLSMNAVLLERSSGPLSTTCYNLCRLNKRRQAQAGIIPLLMRVIELSSTRSQFAFYSVRPGERGKSCWMLQCPSNFSRIPTFLSSLFWHGLKRRQPGQRTSWRDPSKLLDALLKCFISAKAGSFENLLDPFLKICRHSTPIAIGIANAQFFRRVSEELSNSKAVVKLNLLRILRAVCDVHPNRALLVEFYGIHETVAVLRRKDGAVLVREIEPSLAPALKPSLRGADTPKSSNRAEETHHALYR